MVPDNFIFLRTYEGAKCVEWEILNNYGDSYVGAQEIGFTGAVPEPATVGLLVISGLLIAGCRRIRKSYGL